VEEQNSHIDDLLKSTFDGVEIDGNGIDWNAFQNKKIRKFLLWFIPLGITAAFLLSLGIYTLTDKKEVEQEQDSISENSIVESKEEIVSSTIELREEHPSFADQSGQQELIQNPENTIIDNSSALEESTSFHPDSKSLQEISAHHAAAEMKSYSKDNAPNIREPIPELAFMDLEFPIPTWTYAINHDFIPYISVDSNIGIPNSESSELFFSLSSGIKTSNPNVYVAQTAKQLIHKDYNSVRNAAERGSIGYTIEAVLGKSFGKFEASMGLGYSRINIAGDYGFDYSEHPVLDLDGSIIGYRSLSPEKIAFTSNHSYDFVQLPLSISYRLVTRNNFNLRFLTGLNAMMLLNVDATTPDPVFLDEIWKFNTSNTENTSFEYKVGLPVQFKMKGSNWGFFEPSYNHNFGINHSDKLYGSKVDLFSLNFGWKKYF